MKIVTAEQMRQIDRECVRLGTPEHALMENAGKAVAEEIRLSLGVLENQHVICLVGAGNNGGDALVAARYLHEWGAKVNVYLCAARAADDANLRLVKERGITCVEAAADSGLQKYIEMLASATCVIDGLLGTGKMRPLEGLFKEVLEKVSAEKQRRPIFIAAIDLPSGMDANTGAVDSASLFADLTVTLAFPKPGLFMFPGAERVGKLKIADIGIPESLAGSAKAELLDEKWARRTLPKRPLNANKGTFGRVLAIAGSVNYIGAACLACNGALRAGAGLVTLAIPVSLQSMFASGLIEVTYLPLPESRSGIASVEAAEIVAGEGGKYDVMLIGCGIGQDAGTVKFVDSIIRKKKLPSLVIDADGLNIITGIKEWRKILKDDVILTPHPGEMARLSGLSIDVIQADRIGMAVKCASEWQKTIILKGAYTVIAAPDGCCRVSPFANPGLASAGTGDVLTGVIAGLVAQGMPLFEAASLGVFLHAQAGEMVKNTLGDAGMIASDLLKALPVTIKQIKEHAGIS